MAEVEEYVLNKEDFLTTKKPDGTIVLTHSTLSGTIELGPKESPMWLFPRLKEFSEKHGVLLSPELAKLVRGMEEDLERAGREEGWNEEEDLID